MENAFCFCDGVMILSPNVALSICVDLRGVRALWVKSTYLLRLLVPHPTIAVGDFPCVLNSASEGIHYLFGSHHFGGIRNSKPGPSVREG